MENFIAFYESQLAICLRDIIQLLPPDKSFSRFWNKNVRKEIYRKIRTFAFHVIQECNSWASKNGPLQCFLWHQPETCFCCVAEKC